MEYESPIKAKTISFDYNFVIEEEKEHEFEHWVNKTSKLIERPYFQTFKLVEKWPMEQIIRMYELATKHCGNCPPNIKWWAERKRMVK